MKVEYGYMIQQLVRVTNFEITVYVLVGYIILSFPDCDTKLKHFPQFEGRNLLPIARVCVPTPIHIRVMPPVKIPE